MQSKPSNRLLEALPSSCKERLIASSVHTELPLGAPLLRRDEKPRFLYFLTSGIGSVVFTSEDGTAIELATQGSEGLIGWAYLLGPLLNSSDCVMQVGGTAYRVPFAAMQHEFDRSPEIRKLVLEYAQHQNLAVNQIAACNRLHRAKARFARWMLMVSDRLRSDEIYMTQEFMSNMLGTRRTTAAEVCASLGRAGAIEGRRGGLRILSRKVLEAHTCECYALLKTRYEALYQHPSQ